VSAPVEVKQCAGQHRRTQQSGGIRASNHEEVDWFIRHA
jgi:hypothetical protein